MHFPSQDLFLPSGSLCVCALKAEWSRTLRDSLAWFVFVTGFVPAWGECGGLIIKSHALCGSRAWDCESPGPEGNKTRERKREREITGYF